jgi:membrane carboxypeptidase/penicillin-binding protein
MATAFHGEANPLPPFAELAQRSLVFDANKNQIDELRVENREPFKLAQVPQVVIDAVVATEDAGFYEHKGVNSPASTHHLRCRADPPSPSSW